MELDLSQRPGCGCLLLPPLGLRAAGGPTRRLLPAALGFPGCMRLPSPGCASAGEGAPAQGPGGSGGSGQWGKGLPEPGSDPTTP